MHACMMMMRTLKATPITKRIQSRLTRDKRYLSLSEGVSVTRFTLTIAIQLLFCKKMKCLLLFLAASVLLVAAQVPERCSKLIKYDTVFATDCRI